MQIKRVWFVNLTLCPVTWTTLLYYNENECILHSPMMRGVLAAFMPCHMPLNPD